jgi:3alpha(or 20beta)-hydroxysteroid dehydrogenase
MSAPPRQRGPDDAPRHGRLGGKVALVTGAASGIGAEIAAVFVSEGCRVVIADIQPEQGVAIAARLGPAAIFVHLDVGDRSSWDGAIATTLLEFERLDILVNNACAPTGIVRIDRETPEDHERQLRVNLTGVWHGIRAVVPAMSSQGGGSIINISSMNGLVGVAGQATQVATKFAVTGITRATSMELGKLGIRVNSIHPGVIDTPGVAGLPRAIQEGLRESMSRQAIKRLGRPEEVAKAALFFASDESSYCAGSALLVDGGHTAGRYRDLPDD